MNSYESMTSGKWTVSTHPVSSGAVLLACGVLAMLVLQTASPVLPWKICGIGMLFFGVYNQVMGLFVRRWPVYVGLSYLVFIAYTIGLLVIAGYIADVPLATVPKFKKTFLVLGVFYVFLTMLAGIYRLALYMLGMTTRP